MKALLALALSLATSILAQSPSGTATTAKPNAFGEQRSSLQGRVPPAGIIRR